MASLSRNSKTGRRLIQFTDRDGNRQTIRLGAATAKDAKTIQGHVEKLIVGKLGNTAVDADTAAWLGVLDGELRERLARVGLVEPREKLNVPTVAEWVAAYIAGRTDVKPNTLRNLKQAGKDLAPYLGSKRLDEVTEGDGNGYRAFLKGRGLGEATTRRQLKRAKQFLAAAVKARLLAVNPFAGLRCGQWSNPDRYYYVTPAEALAVLAACPDAETRLIFALARYGGLRCPSEILALRWGDIDWAAGRFIVHSTKTEGHAHGGVRLVPIFPELAGPLADAFDAAAEGAEHVIVRYRSPDVNLRTRFTKIILRAGLTPWGKLFQNCRSSRETELCEEYPLHVVCGWLGNTTTVAQKHYLQTTEEHFAKATKKPPQEALQKALHNALQHGAETGGMGMQAEGAELIGANVYGPVQNNTTPCDCKGLWQIPPRGLEPLSPG